MQLIISKVVEMTACVDVSVDVERLVISLVVFVLVLVKVLVLVNVLDSTVAIVDGSPTGKIYSHLHTLILPLCI